VWNRERGERERAERPQRGEGADRDENGLKNIQIISFFLTGETEKVEIRIIRHSKMIKSE
jgi:hypothetical protein